MTLFGKYSTIDRVSKHLFSHTLKHCSVNGRPNHIESNVVTNKIVLLLILPNNETKSVINIEKLVFKVKRVFRKLCCQYFSLHLFQFIFQEGEEVLKKQKTTNGDHQEEVTA